VSSKRKSLILKETVYDPQASLGGLRRLRGRVENELPVIYRESWKEKSDLKELLDPLGPAEFSANYLGKKIYHFKTKKPDRLEKYFSHEAFSRMLAGGLTAAHATAFAADQVKLSVEDFTRAETRYSTIDPLKLARHFRSGGSVVIKHIDNYNFILGQLARDLETWTNFDQAFVNLYFTPKGAQTFGWHQDGHDVLIFQVEGKKVWEIYKPHYRVPFFPSNVREFSELGLTKEKSELLETVILEKGDLLYIPSCFPHEVRCLPSDDSLHLTVGFLAQQRHVLLTQVIQDSINRLINNAILRAPVFRSSTGGLDARETELLLELSKEIFSNIEGDDFDRVYQEYLSNKTMLAPNVQRANMQALLTRQPIKPDSLLTRTNTFCILDAAATTVILKTQKRRISLDAKVTEALSFLIQGGECRFEEVPGPLTITDKIELVWILVDIGLLHFNER